MRPSRIFVLIVVAGLLLADLAVGQEVERSAETDAVADKVTEFSFELTEWNNIVINAIINEKETVRLMLHTGNQGIALTEEATGRIDSIKFENHVESKSWGGNSESRYSEGNKLAIADLTWNDVTIFEDLHSGNSTDGKIGVTQFGKKILSIDFETKKIRISQSLPADLVGYAKLPMTIRRGAIFVSATVAAGEERASHEFMVHSGYSGAMLLDNEFVAQNEFIHDQKVLSQSELKDSFGNKIQTKQIQLPMIILDETEFPDVPAATFEGTVGSQRMSVIGADLLKRFNVLIDFQKSELYLKPNSLSESPWFKKS